MSWQPSTRVGNNDETCAYDDCRERNTDTSLYVVEGFECVRYLCAQHFAEIARLFRLIEKCHRCERNKAAENDRFLLSFFSLKFNGRVWECCDSHRLAYDSLVIPLY